MYSTESDEESHKRAVRSKTGQRSDNPTQSISRDLLNQLNDIDLMDRFQRAQIFRESLGSYESEVICGPESDLHQHYDDFKKNPDHSQFKPIRKFTFADLPLPYRHPGLYRLLQDLALLTVRVSVAITSVKRQSENDVLKSIESTKGLVRYGTGRVTGVKVFKGAKAKICECPECFSSGAPRGEWGLVDVITARHVVYDQDEALATTCRWGYDGDDCPEVNWTGCHAKFSETEDWCRVRCVSHDVKLLGRLEKKLEAYNSSALQLYESWRNCNKNAQPKFIAIVSHPHGCPKQISFGFLRKRINTGGVDLYYVYTAATCHGSSGASVFLYGRDGRNGLYSQIHSGQGKDGHIKGGQGKGGIRKGGQGKDSQGKAAPKKTTPNYGNYSVAVSWDAQVFQ